MVIKRVASHEYKNDYFYIILREAPEHGPQAFILCCGINILKFDPLCRGLAGICSNPAFKGLQLLRADISAIALKKGARSAKMDDYGECMLISPKGEGWYRETMVLTAVTPRIAGEILEYGVKDLLTKVLTVCAPGAKIPKPLPGSRKLEEYIRSLEKRS
jgi:hypothetical protein